MEISDVRMGKKKTNTNEQSVYNEDRRAIDRGMLLLLPRGGFTRNARMHRRKKNENITKTSSMWIIIVFLNRHDRIFVSCYRFGLQNSRAVKTFSNVKCLTIVRRLVVWSATRSYCFRSRTTAFCFVFGVVCITACCYYDMYFTRGRKSEVYYYLVTCSQTYLFAVYVRVRKTFLFRVILQKIDCFLAIV